jgi:hypothetical protein
MGLDQVDQVDSNSIIKAGETFLQSADPTPMAWNGRRGSGVIR